MVTYRIHGDNIIECERIANIIIDTLNPENISYYLVSPSTIAIDFNTTFMGKFFELKLELLPGFNKNNKKHWNENIFDSLKEAGSFFDETPDAIISIIEDEKERILLGIEFCSALQAGNQAWQRSARAFSTGRTGCPYLYVVDFVKYELDNKNRSRKALRFPNAAVPYSYVNYSKVTGNFVAQLYTKSEEFDKLRDFNIASFDEKDFGYQELGIYMVKLMLGMNTECEQKVILSKNMNIVQFLANRFNRQSNFTAEEWREIYNLPSNKDIVDYSIKKARFNFHKKIANKSHHGKSEKLIQLIDQIGIGLASRDLPFGIIPSKDRPYFAEQISQLYPKFEQQIINSLGLSEKHLIIAIFKGFKPQGDDNRPDRGALPLASMLLTSSDVDILTYIYGPVIERNANFLDNNPIILAQKNGLWRSVLTLSNYVILDAPILTGDTYAYDIERIYDTNIVKKYFSNLGIGNSINPKPAFESMPISFGEDDVDTGIHYLFTHILKKHCFEGMCNPPGGDWSGFSVIYDDYESRWLSLPRVSNVINGKRPDHILEIFDVFEKPLLLSIESKEKSFDLEVDVGTKLITYIENLMTYVPSTQRKVIPTLEAWQWGNKKVDFKNFEIISATAYLKKHSEPPSIVLRKKCEILFIMNPIIDEKQVFWQIEIITYTERGNILKKFIIDNYINSGDKQFRFI